MPKRWTNFFELIGDIQFHIKVYRTRVRPYVDRTLLTVGFVCRETNKIWQINSVLLTDTLPRNPCLVSMMHVDDGRIRICSDLNSGVFNFDRYESR